MDISLLSSLFIEGVRFPLEPFLILKVCAFLEFDAFGVIFRMCQIYVLKASLLIHDKSFFSLNFCKVSILYNFGRNLDQETAITFTIP